MKNSGRPKPPQTGDNVKGPARRVPSEVSLDTLMRDLDDIRQKALELGASMAKIVPARWAEVDERVRLKCFVPMCGYYGKNPYCPPNGPDPEFMRRALGRYSWAILYAIEVLPVADFSDRTVQQEKGRGWARNNIEIAGRIETLAFGNGYYLAAGFSQGSCRTALCGPEDACQVLEGKRCAHALKSRPSIEAAGVDVFRLVTRAGWDIYPIYRSVDPTVVPRALSVGIVFIC